jgi:hypothetical protein
MFGAMPTIVFFIAPPEGASGGGAFFSSWAAVASVAPQTPQCAAGGFAGDPQRGQTIMRRAYHVEVAGRPEFE